MRWPIALENSHSHTHTNAQAYNKKIDRQSSPRLFPQRQTLSLSFYILKCVWVIVMEVGVCVCKGCQRAKGLSLFDMAKNTAKPSKQGNSYLIFFCLKKIGFVSLGSVCVANNHHNLPFLSFAVFFITKLFITLSF